MDIVINVRNVSLKGVRKTIFLLFLNRQGERGANERISGVHR